MKTEDFKRFDDCLSGAWSAITNGKETPAPTTKDFFWRSFSKISIEDFEAAMFAHTQNPKRGQFVPKPADIVAALEEMRRHDGRPSADEAWAIALQALDEQNTVVWTRETAAAWWLCMPVTQRDRVGGRKAFIASYERSVEQARVANEPVVWETTVGTNAEMRTLAIEQAAARNLITCLDAVALIANVAGGQASAAVQNGRLLVDRRQPKLEAEVFDRLAGDARAQLEQRRREREAAEAAAANARAALPRVNGEALAKIVAPGNQPLSSKQQRRKHRRAAATQKAV